jgi:hypothetical protein
MTASPRTAEEMLAHYIQTMGQELGELFNAISDELQLIHWRWNQYLILFDGKPSQIDLLNEAAPFFFRIVHDVLFEVTILAIARITGPHKSAGKTNLTITRLPDLVTPELKDRVSELVEAAKKSAEFSNEWRHQYLAHRDLDLALRNPNVQPLAPVNREHVEAALSALRHVLVSIEGKYCNAHTAYSYSHVPGDARALLHYIKSGLSHDRDQLKQWKGAALDVPRS